MRAVVIVIILCLLTGCATGTEQLEKPMQLRKSLLQAEQCSFEAAITAHYPEVEYQFQLTCLTDASGTLTFTVISPDSISGISGQFSNDGAALTFDDQVLAFPVLADDRLSPVSGPWIFYHTLRSGFISGCQENGSGYLLSMDDSYSEDPLHLQIQLSDDNKPIHAEIYYQQRMVLSLDIMHFTLV